MMPSRQEGVEEVLKLATWEDAEQSGHVHVEEVLKFTTWEEAEQSGLVHVGSIVEVGGVIYKVLELSFEDGADFHGYPYIERFVQIDRDDQ